MTGRFWACGIGLAELLSLKSKLLLATLVSLAFCASLSQMFTLPPYATLDSRNRTPTMSVPNSATLTSPPASIFARIDGIRENASENPPPTAPDPQVAAGPNNVVEMANSKVEIFSKQGASLRNSTFSSFFKSSQSPLSDPSVIYDASSGRWFATINTGTLDVSSSSDPLGSWHVYNFTSCGGDQPKLGVNDDKIVISTNTLNEGASNICVINKSELVAGDSSIDLSSFTSPYVSVHPVQSLSPTTTEYMVSTGVNPTNVTRLFALSGTPPGNVTIVQTNLPIAAVTQPAIPPWDSNEGYDFRVQVAAWFKGKLWYTLNDGCTPINGTLNVGCIRLTEINTNTSSILQDFDFGIAGQEVFFPVLQIHGNGNLDVVYGYYSSTIPSSIAVTGQSVNDPVDSLRQPASLKTGIGGGQRWGDYYGAAVDPSDRRVVWVAGEYAPTNDRCPSGDPALPKPRCWGTFIGSMSIQSFTMSMNPATLNMSAPSPGGIATGQANLTISSFGFSGQITLSNSPNYDTALNGPLLGYSQTGFNMTPGQTITITVSAFICSSTPSRTFTITGTSTVSTDSTPFTVTITGQRSGSCPY